MPAIWPLIWANRKIIMEATGCLVVAVMLWWGFYYNPRKIEALEADKAQLVREVEARDAAINLLTDIGRNHDSINKASFKVISSIRYSAKPSRSGVFYSDRMP